MHVKPPAAATVTIIIITTTIIIIIIIMLPNQAIASTPSATVTVVTHQPLAGSC
jgi:hypothetical protein